MKEGLIKITSIIGILAGAFGIFVGSVGALFSTDIGAALFSLLICAVGISAIVIGIMNMKRMSMALSVATAVLVVFIPNLHIAGIVLVSALIISHLFIYRQDNR